MDDTPPANVADDFPTLALLHLEGRADPLQRAELERRLLSDPTAATQLAQLAETHALLREAGQAGLLRARSTPRATTVRRARREMPWGPLAAGFAALVMVATLAASRFAASQEAPLAASAPRASPGGAVLRDGRTVALAEGTELRPADTIIVPAAGSARLRFADGSELALGGDTTLRWVPRTSGILMQLDRGSLVADIAPRSGGQPFVTASRHATVTVLGTRFSLSTDDQRSAVTVDHGSVQVREPRFGAVTVLQGGQRLECDAGSLLRSDAPVRPAASGTGLVGEYFDREDLSQSRLSRLDPKIAFDWGDRAPDQRLERETFSVRWTGSLLPAYSEVYTFSLTIDDGARLWIDGRLVIDEWHLSEPQEYTGTIALEAARLHDIRLEYFQRPRWAQITLRWSSASQPREVVPTARLYPLSGPPPWPATP